MTPQHPKYYHRGKHRGGRTPELQLVHHTGVLARLLDELITSVERQAGVGCLVNGWGI